ncbi:hypothetical protein NDU88_006096 [Pleurodeles waltl]|uniref:PARP catalytic domain-containing protein n=1 Tax=Pleurodeles waltl TaxID=8319 RepID=A0AAV7UK19_PLEWA|nr:hypothetical protein NDU88_006096 [Pleurodeles waltl]
MTTEPGSPVCAAEKRRNETETSSQGCKITRQPVISKQSGASVFAETTMKFFCTDKPEEPNIWAEEGLPFFQEDGIERDKEPINGKIYVMYYGTTIDAAASILQNGFRQSEDGTLGRGVYVSRDIEKARRAAFGNEHLHVVLKLRINVGKAKKIDQCEHPLQKTWHDHGYDSAWILPGSGVIRPGSEKDCVWDPHRIKVVEVVSAPRGHKGKLRNLLKANSRQ